MRRSVAGGVCSVAGAVVLLAAGCSVSTESLESETADMPGVLSVEAAEDEGDGGIPFQAISKTVDIRMEADASAEEVLAVFEAYEEAVDDGDIQHIRVVLDGPKEAMLMTGTGFHATLAYAQDLVAAQADVGIADYFRYVDPVLPGVDIRLNPSALKEATAVVDRYREADQVELVQVQSGGFTLIRDEVNGPGVALYDARESFAIRVDTRFRLNGAVISNRGALELSVAADDLTAAREFVDGDAASQTLGRVVVRAAG